MATRGEWTEAVVLERFIRLDLQVMVPWRNDLPYDLVVSADGERFFRVQCKSGRERRGCVQFNSRTTDHGTGHRDYRGRADIFAVFCPTLDEVYVVPVDEASSTLTHLRLRPALNNQIRRTRLAEHHTVERWARRLRTPVAA
jgi:hypothetical protein